MRRSVFVNHMKAALKEYETREKSTKHVLVFPYLKSSATIVVCEDRDELIAYCQQDTMPDEIVILSGEKALELIKLCHFQKEDT